VRVHEGLLGLILLASAACVPQYHSDAYDDAPDTADVDFDGELPVLLTTRLNRPAEVVAIVDVHVPHGHHDGAIQELRRRASELGADAVVGVEFHHGDPRTPLHLSGLAVRVLR
jgi:hypothetical protein